MSCSQDLKSKKEQKKEETNKKAMEYYHRINRLRPIRSKTKLNGMWVGEKNYPLALDCLAEGKPFVPPEKNKGRRKNSGTSTKQTHQEECSMPLGLQECQTYPETAVEIESFCEEVPTVVTDLSDPCAVKQLKMRKLREKYNGAERQKVHSDKASTKSMRIKKLKEKLADLEEDSNVQAILLLCVPNKKEPTYHSVCTGTQAHNLLRTPEGMAFYSLFRNLTSTNCEKESREQEREENQNTEAEMEGIDIQNKSQAQSEEEENSELPNEHDYTLKL